LIVNGLPRHYHPVLKYDHIRRGMDDRFFIVIDASDPRFNLANTKALLEKAGGQNVVELEA
jgi:ActD protein